MTVYVDEPQSYPPDMIAPAARRYGVEWSHLWADDVEELHAFAKRIHLKRGWFQNRPRFPHYDVVPTIRQVALSHGAEQLEVGDWLRRQRERPKP